MSILEFQGVMIVFTTDKPLTKRQFFFIVLSMLTFLLAFQGLLLVFFPAKADVSPYSLGGYVLATVAYLLHKETVHEIRFDEMNKELHFYSKGYMTKLRKKKTSFGKLSVKKDIWESKRKWLPKRKIFSLEIFKEKTLVFSVDMNQDHFTEEKLNAIIEAFESNNIPVRE